MNEKKQNEIHIAGDVCLDVVGIPESKSAEHGQPTDNWQLTGETDTHYLLGGTMLLADFVRAAIPEASVKSTQPWLPEELACGEEQDQPLAAEDFLKIAERLRREEIIHSLLELACYAPSPGSKDQNQMRVIHKHGFSGPKDGKRLLKLTPPESDGNAPEFLILDDTGNRFRRTPSQWPAALTNNNRDGNTLLIHKLHRPLPGGNEPLGANTGADSNQAELNLWQVSVENYPKKRIVIVSIDDLRAMDATISCGLSWERTALELVWQLLNVEKFSSLRNCPHLIVRMGLNGAIYWKHLDLEDLPPEKTDSPENVFSYRAWIFYDPQGIEGTGESAVEGEMVGYSSVFTAALVKYLDAMEPCEQASLSKVDDSLAEGLKEGIKAGLAATRLLLKFGFGKQEKIDDQTKSPPHYPVKEIFSANELDKDEFACQSIPIIPHAAVPDRGYWRLLDTIFRHQKELLHRAVALKATDAKAISVIDKNADRLLKQAPLAVFAKALRTYDRREIENYRSLYSLMLDYVRQVAPPRPLSVAVFGPPGSGKSFGVKMVAKALSALNLARPIKALTFNLSQYQKPEQLSDAFHLIRDTVLQGAMPLVFFDEFDTTLAGIELGWLRYFLAPMQDGEFLDHGTPHPIGPAIFVFAGGTCDSYATFAKPFHDSSCILEDRNKFKAAKGPDFLSRLRGTLDIPGLDLNAKFDPYGPVEAFPCAAAILLRRANILCHQLGQKAPQLRNQSGAFQVSPVVLRALLHLPHFSHGNRSFEALLDMSHLPGATNFVPSLLPSSRQIDLHAKSQHLSQLLMTDYPFPPAERELIAQSIHREYLDTRKSDPNHNSDDRALKEWAKLDDDLKESNRVQADHIATKLHAAGLWYRKRVPGAPQVPNTQKELDEFLERLAIAEHDRWASEKRAQGWIAAPCSERDCRSDKLLMHNFLFPWDELPESAKDLDCATIEELPAHLAAAGYEIIKL